MNEAQAPEEFPPSPQPADEHGTLRSPQGLPDAEPLRRAASLLRVASAALAEVQHAAGLNLAPNGHDLHKLVCACQELTTEWINACGPVEPRKQWLAWDALDVLELIDMAVEADSHGPLDKSCNTAADLLERLARDCEAASATGKWTEDVPEAAADRAMQMLSL